MMVVYIAHPIASDPQRNLQRLGTILRDINLHRPDVVPFAHYYVDCCILDDCNPAERARGIVNDIELMSRGFIDEIWLYGDEISRGMEAEIWLAMGMGIPVIPMTLGTKEALKRFPISNNMREDL